mgnify:CR=1 FL=1
MLKIQTSKARFNKLVKKVASKKVRKKILRLFTEEIAEESKKYITQGKVTPELAPSTIRNRRKRGVTNQKPLLFKKGLRDSIKATKRGVSFAKYGQLHRDGYTVAKSAYAKFNRFVGKKVPPREFIAYFADESIKRKIDKRVRKRYMEEINKRR